MFANTPEPPYYVVVFTSQRTEVDEGYHEMNDSLYEDALKHDGYIGGESLRDENGFGVAVLYWRDMESIAKWGRYEKHLRAKEQGKEKWYSGYKVRIGKVEREYGPAGS